MDERAGIPQPQPRAKNAPQLAKTKMCKFFSTGTCKRGAECSFAHTLDEVQQKPDLTRTSLCQTYLRTGTCDQPNCAYAHGKHELRSTADFFKMKICRFARDSTCQKGSACRFAHPATKQLCIKEEGREDALTDEADLTSTNSSPNSTWLGCVRERSARRSWAEESEDTYPDVDGASTADNSSPSPRRSTLSIAANIPEDGPRSEGGSPQQKQRRQQQEPLQPPRQQHPQQYQQQQPLVWQQPTSPPGQHEPRQQLQQLQQQQLQQQHYLRQQQQQPQSPHPQQQSPHPQQQYQQQQQQQYLQQRQQHQPIQPQQFPQYSLDVPGSNAAIPPSTTTVMLAHLPGFLTQAAVMDLLEEKNLHISSRFDFFYCPWYMQLGKNMGYAIINLDSAEAAAQFVRRWDGQAFFDGAQPLRALPAPEQGLLANLQQYSGSPVARQADPRKRPLVRVSPAEPLRPLELSGWCGQVQPPAPYAQAAPVHGAPWGPCCAQQQHHQQRQVLAPVPGLAALPRQACAPISGFLPM